MRGLMDPRWCGRSARRAGSLVIVLGIRPRSITSPLLPPIQTQHSDALSEKPRQVDMSSTTEDAPSVGRASGYETVDYR